MTKVAVILGSSVLFLCFISVIHADVNIPGLGSGAYDVPSVGGPGDKVEKAPSCETHLRPTITKVTPDPVKPGEKITITLVPAKNGEPVGFSGAATGKVVFADGRVMTMREQVPAQP